jgi:hypothetical protein
MNKKFKKYLPILFLLLVMIPVFASAEIIPCGGHILDKDTGAIIGEQDPCDFNFLMKLVDNIIDWIIMISVPIAAGVFAWAGLKYMTSSVVDQKSEAKAMLWKVFWGFVAILSAWIVVSTILDTLLNPAIRGNIQI